MDGHGGDDMSKHAKVIKQIEVAFKAGKYGEAMDLCNLAISINPKDPIAYRAKGRLLQMQRKFEEAIKYYDAAERRGAKDADDFVNRGMCKADLQRYEEAILDFTKALEFDPALGDGKSYYYRGLCYQELKHYSEAVEDFQIFLDTSKDETLLELSKVALDEISASGNE